MRSYSSGTFIHWLFVLVCYLLFILLAIYIFIIGRHAQNSTENSL